MKGKAQRGVCPDCGEEKALTSDGVLRLHQTGVVIRGELMQTDCSGTWRRPTRVV